MTCDLSRRVYQNTSPPTIDLSFGYSLLSSIVGQASSEYFCSLLIFVALEPSPLWLKGSRVWTSVLVPGEKKWITVRPSEVLILRSVAGFR